MKNRLYLMTVGALLLCLTGCADPILLRHPETGETVQCGPYAKNDFQRERACVQDFQQQGYQRVMK